MYRGSNGGVTRAKVSFSSPALSPKGQSEWARTIIGPGLNDLSMSEIVLVLPMHPLPGFSKITATLEWKNGYVDAKMCDLSSMLTAGGSVINLSPLLTSSGSVSSLSEQVTPV